MRIVQTFSGNPGATTKVASTNTAAIISTSITQSGGVLAKTLLLTVETFSIRIAFGGTVPTTSTGHLLKDGDVLRLDNRKAIETLRVISGTTDAHASLQVTAGF